MPFDNQLTPYAKFRARQRNVPIDLIEEAFVNPDDSRQSDDEPERSIRIKYLPDGRRLEVVVENDAYTVVTVWIKKGDA